MRAFRLSYIPSHLHGSEPLRPEGTDLEIWQWEENGRPYATAFQGKARKPLWDYWFSSVQSRNERIESTIQCRKEYLARKEAEKETRRAFRHDFKVGDFLSCSWGYDQTNVDFYEVVGVPSGKSIKIRRVGCRVARESQTAEYVEPVAGKFLDDKPATKRVNEFGIRINSFSSARKWDGSPCYRTAFGWGH